MKLLYTLDHLHKQLLCPGMSFFHMMQANYCILHYLMQELSVLFNHHYSGYLVKSITNLLRQGIKPLISLWGEH